MGESMSIGTLLADRRKEKGMTQQDVADRLKTSRANYSHMETTRRRDQNRLLVEVCEVLDIDPLEMVLALGFKVRLPDGVQDLEEAKLLDRWRNLPAETKSFLRAALRL